MVEMEGVPVDWRTLKYGDPIAYCNRLGKLSGAGYVWMVHMHGKQQGVTIRKVKPKNKLMTFVAGRVGQLVRVSDKDFQRLSAE